MKASEIGFITGGQWAEFERLYPEAHSHLIQQSMETELSSRARHMGMGRMAQWELDRIRELKAAIAKAKGESR